MGNIQGLKKAISPHFYVILYMSVVTLSNHQDIENISFLFKYEFGISKNSAITRTRVHARARSK